MERKEVILKKEDIRYLIIFDGGNFQLSYYWGDGFDCFERVIKALGTISDFVLNMSKGECSRNKYRLNYTSPFIGNEFNLSYSNGDILLQISGNSFGYFTELSYEDLLNIEKFLLEFKNDWHNKNGT